MSLEKNIQDLMQGVNLLCKAVDLNTAVLADINSALLEVQNRINGQPNIEQTASTQHEESMAKADKAKTNKAKTKVEKAAEQEPLTDEQIKDSSLYSDFQNLMGEYVSTAEGYGVPKAEAVKDAVALLKRFSEDGKVLSLARAILEAGDSDEATRIKNEFKKAILELQLANTDKPDDDEGTDNGDDGGDGDDFGDEDKSYTDDDVKIALRAYAAIEGRPAAVAKLKELTGGKSAVKDIPESDYAKVIAGLKA